MGRASRAMLLAGEALAAQVACRSTSTQPGDRELAVEASAAQHGTAQTRHDEALTYCCDDELTEEELQVSKVAVYGAPPAPPALKEAIERLQPLKRKSLGAKCSTDAPSCTSGGSAQPRGPF